MTHPRSPRFPRSPRAWSGRAARDAPKESMRFGVGSSLRGRNFQRRERRLPSRAPSGVTGVTHLPGLRLRLRQTPSPTCPLCTVPRYEPQPAVFITCPADERETPISPLPWRSWKSWRSWRPSGSAQRAPESRLARGAPGAVRDAKHKMKTGTSARQKFPIHGRPRPSQPISSV